MKNRKIPVLKIAQEVFTLTLKALQTFRSARDPASDGGEAITLEEAENISHSLGQEVTTTVFNLIRAAQAGT